MFRVELLPAKHGDAIWIEYSAAGSTRRMLVDGGPIGAYDALEARVRRVPKNERLLELLVVTHVDSDHIEGIIKLLDQPQLGLRLRDLWFNGWTQLTWPLFDEPATRSPMHGSFLEVRIRDHAQPWNRWFGGRAVMASRTALPVVDLDGGCRVTVLSPNAKRLESLRTAWERAAAQLDVMPDDLDFFAERLLAARRYRDASEATADPGVPQAAFPRRLDPSVANGSSIALLVEFEGRSCLLLGDAHASVLEASIRQLLANRGQDRLHVDAVKASHHGSAANLSAPLLALLDAEMFLFSTNSEHHGHPDESAIELVLRSARRPPTLVFNYRTRKTGIWGEASRLKQYGHQVVYPDPGEEGVARDLSLRHAP
jgi:hypothetical protein